MRDKASQAVQSVITEAGFAVEAVHHDYGEDLLVQTSHEGEMDASRLWFQVKGTEGMDELARQGERFAYSFPHGHLMRWIRSGDPVVVVLWDVPGRVGYFAQPEKQVDEPDYDAGLPATTTLYFSKSDVLDSSAVRRLAWLSRMQRYRMLILSAMDAAKDSRLNAAFGEVGGEVDEGRNSVVTTLTIDFLISVNVIERHHGPPEKLWLSARAYETFREHALDLVP